MHWVVFFILAIGLQVCLTNGAPLETIYTFNSSNASALRMGAVVPVADGYIVGQRLAWGNRTSGLYYYNPTTGAIRLLVGNDFSCSDAPSPTMSLQPVSISPISSYEFLVSESMWSSRVWIVSGVPGMSFGDARNNITVRRLVGAVCNFTQTDFMVNNSNTSQDLSIAPPDFALYRPLTGQYFFTQWRSIAHIDPATRVASVFVGKNEARPFSDKMLSGVFRTEFPIESPAQMVIVEGLGRMYFPERSQGLLQQIDLHTGRVSTIAGSAELPSWPPPDCNRSAPCKALDDGVANPLNPVLYLIYVKALAYYRNHSTPYLYFVDITLALLFRMDLTTNQVQSIAGQLLNPGRTDGDVGTSTLLSTTQLSVAAPHLLLSSVGSLRRIQVGPNLTAPTRTATATLTVTHRITSSLSLNPTISDTLSFSGNTRTTVLSDSRSLESTTTVTLQVTSTDSRSLPLTGTVFAATESGSASLSQSARVHPKDITETVPVFFPASMPPPPAPGQPPCRPTPVPSHGQLPLTPETYLRTAAYNLTFNATEIGSWGLKSYPADEPLPAAWYTLTVQSSTGDSSSRLSPYGFSSIQVEGNVTLIRTGYTTFFFGLQRLPMLDVEEDEVVTISLTAEAFAFCPPETSQTIGAFVVHAISNPQAAAAQTATTVATATAAVSSALGAGAALDAQTLAVLGLMSCSTPGDRQAMRNPRLLSPLMLSDTMEGMVAGNLILVGIVFVAQLSAVLVIHFIHRASWQTSRMAARFPGFTFTVCCLTYQGLGICSLRLLTSKSEAPPIIFALIAIAFAVCIPLAVALVVRRFVSADFHTYQFDQFQGGKFKTIAPILFPYGHWLPKKIATAYGSMFTGLRFAGYGWSTLPLWSPSLMVVGAAFRPTTLDGCEIQYAALASAQILVALILLVARPFRSFLANFLAILSSLCIAVILVANTIGVKHQNLKEIQTVVFVAVEVQTVVTLLRVIVSIVHMILEQLLFHSVPTAVTLTRIGTSKLGSGTDEKLEEPFFTQQTDALQDPVIQVDDTHVNRSFRNTRGSFALEMQDRLVSPKSREGGSVLSGSFAGSFAGASSFTGGPGKFVFDNVENVQDLVRSFIDNPRDPFVPESELDPEAREIPFAVRSVSSASTRALGSGGSGSVSTTPISPPTAAVRTPVSGPTATVSVSPLARPSVLSPTLRAQAPPATAYSQLADLL